MKKKYPLPGEKWRDIGYGATLVLSVKRESGGELVLFRYLRRNGSPYNSSHSYAYWQHWMRYT